MVALHAGTRITAAGALVPQHALLLDFGLSVPFKSVPRGRDGMSVGVRSHGPQGGD